MQFYNSYIFVLYFHLESIEETDRAASSQAKLFLITLICDLKLSGKAFSFLFFFTFLEISRHQILKWQLASHQRTAESEEEERHASSALICETSCLVGVLNSAATSLSGHELTALTEAGVL